MKRVKSLIAENGATLFVTLVAATMLACLALVWHMERAAEAQAATDADALCAAGNWTKVKAEREEGRDYYVITVRSDNPAVGETQVLAFPWYDTRDASLVEMGDGARFTFERTASRSYTRRHVTSNYVAAKPIG